MVSQTINEFSWIFRRNHQETDFGVDGHVDVVNSEGFVTGQMFAVQIKYGKSFFQEKNRWGYIYRGDEKHFNYILNHPCLVLIIICHPDNQKCYWAAFDAIQAQLTGKNWKITIPFNNDLSTSKNKIEEMLPCTVDGLSLLEEFWAANDVMLSCDYIACFVDISDVEALNVGQLREFFDRIATTKELAHHCMGKVEIAFHGYDDDPRELYEIEKVRKYISVADPIIPELFFFARTEEPTHTLKLFVACLSEIKLPFGKELSEDNKIRIEFEPKQLNKFIEHHFGGLNMMTEWLGLSIEENKRITYSVMRHIWPDVPSDVIGDR